MPPHGIEELAHPEPGFTIVGSKSYGRAPTFLMATGYEQVRSVVAEIAGDRKAAREVQLVLPETGVCSADPVVGSVGGALAVAADPPRQRPTHAASRMRTPRRAEKLRLRLRRRPATVTVASGLVGLLPERCLSAAAADQVAGEARGAGG